MVLNSKQAEAAARYDRKNPPISDEEALEAIDDLSLLETEIATQLEYTDSGSFSSNAEYQSWRHRAMKALSYTKQELVFLREWVKEQERARQKYEQLNQSISKLSKDLRPIAEEIALSARDRAEDIGASFTPYYMASNPPADIESANRRKVFLGAVRKRIEIAFAEITASWMSHTLPREILPSIKGPLHELLGHIEREIRFLKAYLRMHASEDPMSNWQKVCVDALSRAVSEGFDLNQIEMTVLELMIQNTKQA